MSGGRLYTEAEIKRAEAMLLTHTLDQIAHTLGRPSGNTLGHALRQRGIRPREVARQRQEQRWQQIKTLRQGRRSLAEIARVVGISQSRVCRILQQRGGVHMTAKDLRERVLEAHAEGLAGVEIAERLGCSLRSVRRHLPYDNGAADREDRLTPLGALQRKLLALLRQKRAATNRELAEALVLEHGTCNVNECCRRLERRGLVEELRERDRPARYSGVQGLVWALTPDGMRAARKLDR